MYLSKKKKWMATGVAIIVSATMIIFPPFRISAQKTKTYDSAREEADSTTGKRKSASVDRDNRAPGVNKDELDKSMKDLDKAMAELEKQDWNKISESVELAMKQVDLAQIQRSVELAMKSVDMDKIRQSVEMAMKSVDMNKIKADIDRSMKEADWEQIQDEVKDAMKEAKLSMEEAREEMKEEMKHVDVEIKKEMDKARKEIAKSKIETKDHMGKAKQHIELAKIQLAQMKEMLTELEGDGLIKKGDKVNISWKNGSLFLNGKEQPQAISDKYKKYMNLDFHLNKDDDNDL